MYADVATRDLGALAGERDERLESARFAFHDACAADGAAPGVEDPAGIDPIACPADLVAGDKCDDENGPIDSIGCCTPEGTVYFCDTQTDPNAPVIVTDECGA